jgi:NTE family protein
VKDASIRTLRRHARSAFPIIGLCAVLLGCASIQNAPVNQPGSSADLAGQLHEKIEERAAADDDLVGL